MVNIYLASGSRAPRRIQRTNYYILEAETSKGPARVGGSCSCDETMHGASVRTLQAAFIRIHKPVDVKIYTDDQYILGIISELDDLKRTGFKKASGEPLAFAEIWAEISKKIISAQATTEAHSHSDMMARMIREREQ